MNRLVKSLGIVAIAWTAQVADAQQPPAFLLKWGTTGIGDGQLDGPLGVGVDAAGNIYVVEQHNDRIQKFTADGTFITKWGTSGTGDGQFDLPFGVAIDAAGNVYVAEQINDRIQKFTADGTFITKWGTSGTGDGQFDSPDGVAIDAAGNVYVADEFNHRIQKFTADGTFITKWGTSGTGDGQFNRPVGIAIDAAGSVYVSDFLNHRIQKFTADGTFITKWGTSGSGNGQFDRPEGVAIDAAGNVYVADRGNHRIQKFLANGTFISKWGTLGSGDGEFQNPIGVAVDATGNVYVADATNDRIQKFGCPPCPPQPTAGTAHLSLGEPVFLNATDFKVSVLVSTSQSIQFSSFTVDYRSSCFSFLGADPGAAIAGKGSLQPLVTNDDDGTDFAINNPTANRHVLVQATTTNPADAYGLGCNREVVVLRFRLAANPPDNCFLAWDFSIQNPLPTRLNTTVPSQIDPSTIVFCDLLDVCTERHVAGDVHYYQGYPAGQAVINAVVKSSSGSPLALSTPDYALDFPLAASANVTITASRTTENDDKDAVTGFDLIQTLRAAAFTIALNADQERAADVNLSGGVDGSDAQFIAQWLGFLFNPACNPANPGSTNCSARWVFDFDPAGANDQDSHTFALGCDLATVDVKGFLLGDVDGSWPTPFKPGLTSQVGVDLALVQQDADELVVALVADLEREALESALFSLTYDDAALEYAGMEPGPNMPRELFQLDNPEEAGVTHGVLASWKEPIDGSGELVRFRFRIRGPASTEPLTFERLRLNDRAAATVPSLDVDVGEPREQAQAPLPKQYMLKSSPNPFNPNVRVEYAIPEGAGVVPVRLSVYDVAGRLVRTLIEGSRSAGFHVATWDGRAQDGTEARSGLYLLRIQAGDWVHVEKISLVK